MKNALNIPNHVTIDTLRDALKLDENAIQHDGKTYFSMHLIQADIDAVVNADEFTSTVLDEAKTRAKTAVIARANYLTSQIEGQYPSAEKGSWDKQEREAIAVTAAADAEGATNASVENVIKTTEILADQFNDDGETVDTVVAEARAIKANAEAYTQISIEVRKMRRQANRAIDAVNDPADLHAVLAGLDAQATALAKQYGLA